MRKIILAVIMAATVATPIVATPAMAQSRDVRDARRDVREERREYRDALRNGSRGDVREERRELRGAQRDLRQEQREDWRRYRNYDWNRPAAGQRGYYADRYYRDGRYYQTRTLGRNDRIYRGQNGRYYCRRPDGTTGLIIGALGGGLLGNALDNGRSSLLGTVLGAAGGGLLGREIDRGGARCR